MKQENHIESIEPQSQDQGSKLKGTISFSECKKRLHGFRQIIEQFGEVTGIRWLLAPNIVLP
jgi:hypothetical protein